MRIVLPLLATAFVTAPAFAQPAVVLAPSSQWQVDYAENSCALQRLFGEEGQQVALEIRDFGGTFGKHQIIVASKDLPLSDAKIFVTLAPVGQAVEQSYPYSVTLGSGAPGRLFAATQNFDEADTTPSFRAFIASAPNLTEEHRQALLQHVDQLGWANNDLEPAALNEARKLAWQGYVQTPAYDTLTKDTLAAVETLRFSGVFTEDIALRTGSLVAAFKALDSCVVELMSHWGIDTEAHKTLSRHASFENNDTIARYAKNQYVHDWRSVRHEGKSSVRLDISAEGKAIRCHALNPGVNERLQRDVCSTFINHGKYKPALDAQGSPIRSVIFHTIYYRME